MNPAELKAIRITLGIPHEVIARLCEVDSDLVQAWEDGTKAIPKQAVDVIRRRFKRWNDYVAEAVDMVVEIGQDIGNDPEDIPLTMYKDSQSYVRGVGLYNARQETWEEHSSKVAAIYAQLVALNFNVHISYVASEE